MPTNTIFQEASRFSRFWLPQVLDVLASIPAPLANADGCDVFLKCRGDLFLAATTRRELQHRLFEPQLAYTVDPERLRNAADHYRHSGGQANDDASLSGWSCAFKRSLRLRDVRDASERATFADEANGVPEPVWGTRMRGFFDTGEPRPFLVVPMMLGDGDATGVVRLVTTRSNAAPFDKSHEEALQGFADRLTRFLGENRMLSSNGELEEELAHYFRIWAARHEGSELARRITAAVADLFHFDCSSFFQRDRKNRFVLQYAHCSSDLDSHKRRYFERFQAENIGNLYYDDYSDEPMPPRIAKTELCIRLGVPLHLARSRDNKNEWRVVAESLSIELQPEVLSSLREEASGKFLHGRSSHSCELDHSSSRTILLAPVRDANYPRILAGVLRVVSTKDRTITRQNLYDLAQFADDLASCLSQSVRQSQQGQLGRNLIEKLARLKDPREAWSAAARIVAEAIHADSVTIFLIEKEELRATAQTTYLNEQQIVWDQGPDALSEHRRQHDGFRQTIGRAPYYKGVGRTGWAWEHREILNLRDLADREELHRRSVRAMFDTASCEIVEPAPFICGPISLSRDSPVYGVVRAMRSRQSLKGPFSASDEFVLRASTAMLAALAQAWEQKSIAISYSFSTGLRERNRTVRLLKAMGLEPRSLDPGAQSAACAASEFLALARECSVGIVVLTRESTGQISHNVVAEWACLENLQRRVIVLRERALASDEFVSRMLREHEAITFDRRRRGGDFDLLDLAEEVRRCLGT